MATFGFLCLETLFLQFILVQLLHLKGTAHTKIQKVYHYLPCWNLLMVAIDFYSTKKKYCGSQWLPINILKNIFFRVKQAELHAGFEQFEAD